MKIKELDIGVHGFGVYHQYIDKNGLVKHSAIESNVKLCTNGKNYVPIIKTDNETYIVDEDYKKFWRSAKKAKRRRKITQLFRNPSPNPKVIGSDLEAKTKEEIIFENLGTPLAKKDMKYTLSEEFANFKWINKRYILTKETGEPIAELSEKKLKIFSLSDVLKKDEGPKFSWKNKK
jgi:hypothetical protein